MKKTLLTLSVCLTIAYSFSQAPTLQWQKCLGGSGTEYAESIIETSDGGYAVAGWSSSSSGDLTGNYGNYDFWVVKLASNGTISWQKNYGGSNEDRAKCIIQTSDGGFAVAGWTNSVDSDVTVNNGGYEYWVIKINSSGVLQWEKSLGGNGLDQAYSLVEDSDGGIIVAGETQSADGDVSPGVAGCCDSWVVKVNSTGTSIVWKNRFGGGGGERARSIIRNAQGGFAVFGIANSSDGDTASMYQSGEYMIIKINSAGVTTAFGYWGGSSIEEAGGFVQTSDGGFAMAGTTYSDDHDVVGNHHAWQEWWVVKVNASLSLQWQKKLGGLGYDYGYSIAQATDGNLIVGGYSKSNDGDFNVRKGLNDIWLVKLGNTGNIIWKKNYGGTGEDFLYSLKTTTDGSIVMVGATDSDDGDVSGSKGSGDWWVAKTNLVTGIEDLKAVSAVALYPNPATNEIVIEVNDLNIEAVRIYNLQGKLEIMAVKPNKHIDISHLAKGIYITEVSRGNVVERVRWVKL
jgi:hypothetical protein